jgi:hypothetical protein
MAIQIVHAGLPPQHAPGHRVTEALHGSLYVVRSAALNYNEASPAKVFHVPANTLVEKIMAEVVTIHDGAIPSLAVGISGATGRHLQTTDIDLKTLGIYGPSTLAAGAYHYTADTDIIATLVASTDTAGIVRLWMWYRPFSLEFGLARTQ